MEKVEKLLRKEFDSKAVYGDNNKHTQKNRYIWW